jgi:hypothetical protein
MTDCRANWCRRAAALAPLFWALAAQAQNPPATVKIDATASVHAISPAIYGVNFGAGADLVALNAPVNRWGGNNVSTYSWQTNADNLDFDYFFESYPSSTGGAMQGGAADDFVQTSRQAGAQAVLTVPMIGWVAKLGANRGVLPSFSVAKYGAQCATDPYNSDAGDGLKPDCATPITGNDPNDAYASDSATAEQAWIKHLVARWGTAAKGGLPYYLLDNEPSLWSSTHRDIQPVGVHAVDYANDVVTYSKAIKAIDPGAKIAAPEEWGWDGYFYSGYDQQYGAAHGYNDLPDRTTEMGGEDYLPWLLQRWKAAGRPIDMLSVHFYPQGGEYSDDISTATQLLRNRSTRQLWDPNYVSESWIDAPVYLIRRLKGWVQSYYYAGTPVALTEYNWGAESSINGATAQADIYGIFGREGLGAATRWTVPAASTPTYKAMQIYRNYDTHHSTFGDRSVSAGGTNPDDLAVFAATRTLDGALTVVAINKVLSGNTPVKIDLAHFNGAASAKVYQLTSSNSITPLADAAVSAGAISAVLPPQSITLYVLPAAGKALAAPPNAVGTAKPSMPYAQSPGPTPAAGQTIKGYRWDFGDGASATTVAPNHIYTAYGSYTAALTVSGSNGLVSVVQQTISVLPKLQAVTSCTVKFTNTDDWGAGFTGDLQVTNGGSAIGYWNLRWNFPSGQTLTDIWNASGTQTGAAISAFPVYYDEAIGSGATIDIGFNANYSTANAPPTGFTLNGTACATG